MTRLVLLVLGTVWGYVAFGPAGVLGGGAGASLPMPAERVNALGGKVAEIDAEAWRAACRDAGLPELPDPSGTELVPVRLLVEASRRWSETRDPEELGCMGEIALALELHEAALDLFAAARASGGDHERWSYFLGVACQTLGYNRSALAALEAARAADGDSMTTHARIGALHLEVGELDAADRSYARAAELAPTESIGPRGRARVALVRRDYEGAFAHLEHAVRAEPRDYLTQRVLAQALAGLGRLEDAVLAAERSNRLPFYRGWLVDDPRLAQAHARAATQRSLENELNAALSRGDLGAARRAGEALLERLPRSADVLSVFARILANSGELARALELATAAVDIEPEGAKLLTTQADIAIAARDFAAAAGAAELLRALEPASGTPHQILGRVRLLEGRGDEAVAELRQAISLEPQNLQHRTVLVEVLLRGGRASEAEAELEGILAIEPSNAPAQQQLEGLRAGR
ncbi:MAG: tetratricopeptide repeat protein [bacterium]|nr:tetratricopeptide repeat protein [bacterium]